MIIKTFILLVIAVGVYTLLKKKEKEKKNS